MTRPKGWARPPLVPCKREDCEDHVTSTGSQACLGHTSAGRPCRKAPIAGARVCRSHGGAAPQIRAKAKERAEMQRAQRAVQTLGLPMDVSPTEALLEEVRWTAGHVAWLRARVQELGEADSGDLISPGMHPLVWGVTEEKEVGSGEFTGTDTTSSAAPSIWYVLYTKERAHLVQVCATAIKAGVEERRVQLAERQGDLVADVIRQILGDLNLSAEQWGKVSTVVPARLRLLAGGAV